VRGAPAALTVLAPGLAGPADPGSGDPGQASRLLVEHLVLGGLTRLLSRADAVVSPWRAPALDGLLFEALGVPRPPAGDWPAAAVSRLGCGSAAASRDSAAWIRADPVHLRPDMGRLVLLEPATLGLTGEEARSIAEWLNAQEHNPVPCLEVACAETWLAPLEAVPCLATTSPAAAHGADADAHLPTGADAAAWHVRMNELQMLLHACPVNAERERAGRRPVNSLWFWGAGTLPAPPPSRFDAIHGSGPLARGAAAWCGLACESPPGGARDWLAEGPRGCHLLLLDGLHAAARGGDPLAWRGAVADFDGAWLSPLEVALRRGRVQRLEVHAGGGVGFTVTRRGARRWWRRDRPLGDLIARLRRAHEGAW
jgi:hypothetical protein